MSNSNIIINEYIVKLATNFAKDTASIIEFQNVADFINNNKYFDNLYKAGQLLFINTFMSALPTEIIAFKTEIDNPKPNEWTGFDINKLYCALDYTIKKFPQQFTITYYDIVLNPPRP